MARHPLETLADMRGISNYIAEDNPVRVIDVFVDELDLGRPKVEILSRRPQCNRTQLSPRKWMAVNESFRTPLDTKSRIFQEFRVSRQRDWMLPEVVGR